MVGSRMHKLTNIFKRYSGLIEAGAVRFENRPLWFDVYRAFPPSTEPSSIRPPPDIEIRKIFYEEDIMRANKKEDENESAVRK